MSMNAVIINATSAPGMRLRAASAMPPMTTPMMSGM